MEFRLLGPVELWADGQRRQLGTAKERCVLANLLLSPGHPVSVETLIDRLWDEALPAKPRQSLYTYIKRLRDRLADVGDVELQSRSGGYLLQVDNQTIDWHRFRLRREQARAIADGGDEESALELHRAAAQMWRAEPLADLSGGWVLRARKTMEDELLAATFERVEIELRLGHHADLVGELGDLVGRYPYVEKLAGQLMIALYRCGRQAEALEVYHDARHRLADTLGTEAWPELRALYQRILQSDPALLAPETQPTAAKPPNTLQRDIRTFTGRQKEIRQLMETLPVPSGRQRGDSAVSVVTIDGMAGIGKTALALHLAHRLTGHYPDGQLYLNLHAHDPGQRPVEPATALDTLLRVLGVPPRRIPPTLDERAALWRTQLAHSRVLIVLDDAAGRDQVLPLLPGVAECLVIITSRRRLTGLDDVLSQSLEVLPADDAVRLFTGVVGTGRDMDDHAVAEVVRVCGYLPLAIQIAGSRLRHRRAWSVADLLDRLTRDSDRLDELRTEDREITMVFEMSYRGLPPRHQKAFRSYGLHPGPDFTRHAAAALSRSTVAETERILEDLLDCHLITEPVRGRYRFHDLVHEYARRLAIIEDQTDERKRTVHGALDYYLSMADRADRLSYPHRRRLEIVISHPPPEPAPMRTESEAQDWLTAEHDNLISALYYADQHGWPMYTAYLAHVMAEQLEAIGRWEEAVRLHERAVAMGRSHDDRAGLAQALSDLSTVQWRMGRHDQALESAKEALGIRQYAGDRNGEADLLDHIGRISWHRAEFEDALAHYHKARSIRRAVGDQRGEANTVEHIAFVFFHSGRYREAYKQLQETLNIYRSIGDRRRQAIALNNIGDVELRLGHYDTAMQLYEEAAKASEMSRQHYAIWQNNVANVLQYTGRHSDALEYYHTALEIYREIGDRQGQSDVLINIGSTCQRLGQFGDALIHHEQALNIAQEIGERLLEARALRHLGEVHQQTGRHSAALAHHRRALYIAQQNKDPYEQARILDGIGMALLTENPSQARQAWRDALKIYQQLGVPEAKMLQDRLRDDDVD